MYQTSHLPNGMTVASAQMPHMNSVAVGIWVATGGRYEAAEDNGAAHFIEHMLFKGTRKRSAAQISQAVEGIGGYINAFTSEEATCFYARASHDKLDELVDVLADMFLHSKFDSVELEKERQVIKEEVAMYQDQPQQHVQELLSALCWPDQPLGRPLTGTLQGLDGLTQARLLSYYRQNYVSGSTLVTASGRVDHEGLVKSLGRLASKIPSGARRTPVAADPAQVRPRSILCTKEVEQTQMALGIRTCSRHDDRRFALRLLNTILGENMSSRLFQTVREERGLAYSIYSATSSFDDAGMLNISAGLDAERLAEVMKVVKAQLRLLTEKAPTSSELRRARDYVIGQMDLSLEGTESQMNWVGETLLGYGRVLDPSEAKSRMLSVTAAEIRGVAREFFRPERMNLAVVGPRKDSRAVQKLVESPL